MKTVIVKRTDLLSKLNKNRKDHRKDFLDAQKAYREAVIKELDAMLAEARNGSHIRRFITMPEPEDHTSDYDREITMLEMSTENEIEVTCGEFEMYVMDNWSWKQNVAMTNSFYKQMK